MPAARRLGISYTRFSEPYRQSKGDSQDRQDRMYRDFCTLHNLTPLAEVYADKGRSGYKDEHRKKGRLGQLIALAKDDHFEPGTVVVVEAWDRLGRLRPDRQTDLIAELLRTGVSIGVCRLNDIFTEDDFGTHKWTTLAVFIQLAYQESKQKAERVAESWKKRRERARDEGGLLCNRLPAWLEMVNGEVRLIPERQAAMKRIFQLAADGYGHVRIVGALGKAGVRPFGEVVVHQGRSRSQFSGKWTRPYVALILNDRRAVGEYQPRKLDGSPDGPPIAGYFPAAVTEDEWLLARAGQEWRLGKDKKGRAIAARQGKYVNVFKGLLKHARDGEGWVLHNKGTAATPELVLINATGEGGRGRNYTFPYTAFEEGILGLLREVKPEDVMPRKDVGPSRAEVLRGKLANIREDIARLKEDLKAGYSRALADVMRSQEATEEDVAGQLQEELSKTVKPAERAWKELPDLVRLIKDAKDPADVRLKIRAVLRRVVEEAWVLIVPRGCYRLTAVQVFFAGGARREYLIVHRTAGYRRAGGWTAVSLAEAGALDLRDRRDVRRLEELLAPIDVKLLLAALAE
jgi:DNA invertase Pin-like site-specific DNA recombinase